MIIDLYDKDNNCIERGVTLDRMFTALQDQCGNADRAFIYAYDGGPVETVILTSVVDGGGIELRAMDVSKNRVTQRELDAKKVTP